MRSQVRSPNHNVHNLKDPRIKTICNEMNSGGKHETILKMKERFKR